HSLTIGELAKMFNEAFGINCRLDVVPMEGWTRSMWWDGTKLPWILPSPNIPTLDTATVYPGMVIYEGTMVSEGRGTTRPFDLILGTDKVRKQIEADTPISEIEKSWQEESREFIRMRKEYLIYK